MEMGMGMGMGKHIWISVLIVIRVVGLIRCNATTYIVGDTSGWDISTDLDTWSQGKMFFVGDVLVFQYSSSESLNEVTKENFKSCNTTNILKAYSTGNTTVTLSEPGRRFFVSGNRLLCLSGMKLQVNVLDNNSNQSFSPAAAPQHPQPPPSSKTDDNRVPSAAAGKQGLLIVAVCYVIPMAMMVF